MPSLVAPAIARGSLAASEQPVLRTAGDEALRPWRPSDAAAVMAAFQDPAIQRWHVRRADSVAEAREWIDEWRGGWARETGAHWAVVDAGDGALLGRVALKSLHFEDGAGEVAYWMVPAARGRGVCPRAAAAVSAWALGEAGFHRLGLGHSTANEASCRVAAKAGFAAEGIRRGAWLHADGWHDVHVHARIRQSS